MSDVMESVPMFPPPADDPTEPMPAPSADRGEQAPSPDAPWGYRPNGQPYKRDPARYVKREAAKASGSRKASSSSSSSRSKAAASAAERREAGALQVISLLGLPLVIGAMMSDSLAADAFILDLTAPALATELASAAELNGHLAVALDKAAELGPYAGIAMAAAPLICQVMANHGLMPAGMMGTADPAMLAATYRSKMQAAAMEQAAEAQERAEHLARQAGVTLGGAA